MYHREYLQEYSILDMHPVSDRTSQDSSSDLQKRYSHAIFDRFSLQSCQIDQIKCNIQ